MGSVETMHVKAFERRMCWRNVNVNLLQAWSLVSGCLGLNFGSSDSGIIHGDDNRTYLVICCGY